MKTKYIGKVFFRNPNAIKLLKKRIEFENTLTEEELYDLDLEDKIDWYNLSANPNAIDILENNQYHINWMLLSKNPNAIHLLENNLDKVNWFILSENKNAIHIFDCQDDISWFQLSKNPNAIDLLKNNQDNIDWYYLSSNPSIFEDEPMPIV